MEVKAAVETSDLEGEGKANKAADCWFHVESVDECQVSGSTVRRGF